MINRKIFLQILFFILLCRICYAGEPVIIKYAWPNKIKGKIVHTINAKKEKVNNKIICEIQVNYPFEITKIEGGYKFILGNIDIVTSNINSGKKDSLNLMGEIEEPISFEISDDFTRLKLIDFETKYNLMKEKINRIDKHKYSQVGIDKVIMTLSDKDFKSYIENNLLEFIYNLFGFWQDKKLNEKGYYQKYVDITIPALSKNTLKMKQKYALKDIFTKDGMRFLNLVREEYLEENILKEIINNKTELKDAKYARRYEVVLEESSKLPIQYVDFKSINLRGGSSNIIEEIFFEYQE